MSSTSASARSRAAAASPPDLRSNNGIIVITDDTGDPGVVASRAVAAEMAGRCGVPVVLYDRSGETWVDTPHPEGPLPADDRRLDDRAHVRSQMQAIADQDVQVQAWLSTVPTIAGITGALTRTRADVVVVAESAKRKFLERTLDGDSIPQAIAIIIDRHADLDASVVVVSDDGTSEVLRTGSPSQLPPGETPTGDVAGGTGTGENDRGDDASAPRGASTLTEVLRQAADDGYATQMVAATDGQVRCGHCSTEVPASTLHVDDVHRLEGASDPADEMLIATCRCPACGTGGALTLGYGPHAATADVDVLRQLPTG